jgi:hypothetical protein
MASRIITLVLLTVLCSETAAAEVVTRCGASDGFAYYLPGGAVPTDKSRWRKDAITNGRIELLASGTQFDIIHTDAGGVSKSARADGFEIITLPQPQSGSLLIIGVHAQHALMEHWLFNLDADGVGILIWGTSRASTIIRKSALYEAKCTKP